MQWHEPKIKTNTAIKKTVTIVEPSVTHHGLKKVAAGSFANRHNMYNAMGFGLDELTENEPNIASVETSERTIH